MDQQCQQSTQSNLTKNESQGYSNKDPRNKKSRAKKPQVSNNFAGSMKPSEKVIIETKWKIDWNRQERKNGEHNTAIRTNVASIRLSLLNNSSKKKN